MKKTTFTKKNEKIRLPKKAKIQKDIEKLENQKLELTDIYKYKGKDRTKAKIKNNAKVAKYEADKLRLKYKKGTLGQKILILLMLFLIVCLTVGIIFTLYIIFNSPKFDTSNLYSKESSVLLDKNGNEFARLGTENRELVSYEELPEVLIDAIIATEDSRYYQHNGVDLARFSKAVAGQLIGHSDAGGGSTLTMQVVKNAYSDKASSGIKGIIRKFTDIYMAVFKVEKAYTKEQIIEFYVNMPYLGSGSYGVEQASQIYFNKSVKELSLVEAATIAGLFQAPDAYDPYSHPERAQNRRNLVLDLMYRHGYINANERDIAKSIPLSSLLNSGGKAISKYQGFVDTVVSEVIKRTGNDPATTSMVIHTTLDPEEQDVIERIYSGEDYTWLNEVVQAGIAVTDINDGSIAAIGAGRNKKSERSFNYATMIKRHPGSTAKPIFDYGPAIEYLNWSTGTTVVDDTFTYSGGGSIKNWDNTYQGVMTAKTALAQSRNIPALYTFQQLSQEQIKEFVTNLGITPAYESGYINESHSIGGFDGVNPLQMSAAYAAFARNGTYIEPYSFYKIEYTNSGETYTTKPKKTKAMSEATAYMISMMLKYAVTSGAVSTGTVSNTDVASKTGTSTVDAAVKKANKITGSLIGDAWQMTFSPDYSIALWYGYDEITSEHYLTQTEGSSQRKLISKILGSKILKSGSTWSRPSTVVSAEIELETDPLELASSATPDYMRSTELFKKGTVPTTRSTRFETLSDPTNLKYSLKDDGITITWTGINTPKSLDKNYLADYYSKSVFKHWGDKYLNIRIDNNKNIFGKVAYSIYIDGEYIATTTKTNYTYNEPITKKTEIKVVSTYTNYKACDSSGITVDVKPVPKKETTDKTKETTSSIVNDTDDNNDNIEFIFIDRDIMSKNDFEIMERSNTLVTVLLDNKDVTSKAKITINKDNSSLYIINVTYDGKQAQKKINIIESE